MSIKTMRAQFDLIDAFGNTVKYLWLHLLIAAVLIVAFACLSLLKASKPLTESRLAWLASKTLSLGTFALLGLLTAFFVSRGIEKDGGQNSVLTSLAVALVPTITAGIAYLEGGTATGSAQPRAGMAVFLITALISYQMFYYQTTALTK